VGGKREEDGEERERRYLEERGGPGPGRLRCVLYLTRVVVVGRFEEIESWILFDRRV